MYSTTAFRLPVSLNKISNLGSSVNPSSLSPSASNFLASSTLNLGWSVVTSCAKSFAIPFSPIPVGVNALVAF